MIAIEDDTETKTRLINLVKRNTRSDDTRAMQKARVQSPGERTNMMNCDESEIGFLCFRVQGCPEDLRFVRVKSSSYTLLTHNVR